MSVIDILEKIESDGSRLFKERVLSENVDNKILHRFLVMAFDPWKNWGISKYDSVTCSVKVGHSDDALVKFMDLLDALARREITGSKARGAVEGAISTFDEVGKKWCDRLVGRNLRCGVSATTINKIWPNSIVPFAVSLAETLETTVSTDGSFKISEKVNYPVRVEAKLDGLRMVAVKSKGEATLYTRNGTVLETLPRIKAAIAALPFDNFVLDGEAMGEDWNESASVVMSAKSKKDDSSMLYHVFDCVPLTDWQAQKSKLTYTERLSNLMAIIGAGPMISKSPFRYVKSMTCSNEEELRSFYTSCLEENYEGVMLKDVKAKYQWKRSSAILKLKPVGTDEGVIVGWHEAGKFTKRAGQFGGFNVLLPNGVITRVGGGYSDKLKDEINLDPDSYIGKIAECEHQPPLTEDGKMRFPVFSRFRNSSDVDPKILHAYENYKKS
jgi:DNA ligase-1